MHMGLDGVSLSKAAVSTLGKTSVLNNAVFPKILRAFCRE
jgi:hypothetical protein